VAAPQILDEGVPGGQNPRGPVALESAHRPQPGFQPPVICFDRVARVPLDAMQALGHHLPKDPRIGRTPVGGHLFRGRAGAQCPGEEPPGGRQVAPLGQQTSPNQSAVGCHRPTQQTRKDVLHGVSTLALQSR
jgi:hypothetical protein